MNTTKQLTLPTLPDYYSQPQTVAASQLVTAIAQANAAGFRAIALAVLPSGYRVSFQSIDATRYTPPGLKESIMRSPKTG